MQTNLGIKRQIMLCLECGAGGERGSGRQKGESIKGHQETLGVKNIFHYLDCSHAVMNIYVYMTKLIKLYTFYTKYVQCINAQ